MGINPLIINRVTVTWLGVVVVCVCAIYTSSWDLEAQFLVAGRTNYILFRCLFLSDIHTGSKINLKYCFLTILPFKRVT